MIIKNIWIIYLIIAFITGLGANNAAFKSEKWWKEGEVEYDWILSENKYLLNGKLFEKIDKIDRNEESLARRFLR